MNRTRDVGTQLTAALVQQAAAKGCALHMESQRQTAWASATFTGARHEFTFTVERSDAIDGWLTALPEAEFALRGHLVADIVVADRTDREDIVIRIEALTVEEN